MHFIDNYLYSVYILGSQNDDLAGELRMDLLITIIIAIIAGLVLGFMSRNEDAKRIMNWLVFFIVFILSFFFSAYMPFLIALLCAIGCFVYYDKRILNDAEWIAIGVFFAVCLAFIFAYIAIPVASIETVETNISLNTLHDVVAPSGNFFIGSGVIEEDFYYTYNYMQGRDLVPGIIKKTENVHLCPDSTDGKANIYYYKTFLVKDFSQWPIRLIFNGVSDKSLQKEWIEIRVPPNSVIQGVIIDAK